MDEILKAIREVIDEQRAIRAEVHRLGEKLDELRNDLDEAAYFEHIGDVVVAEKSAPAR